ncbi:MAG: DUF1592 domain-containing protein [Verrucomicrobiales bacterium]|nr:DUF1592 domain-containing protein [Verrucomicrobiales bacterium]
MSWLPIRPLLFLLLFTRLSETALCEDVFDRVIAPVLRQNCIQCHGENDKVKGKVNLFEVRSLADLTDDPGLITDLIDVIDFEEMPPEDELQIEPELRKKFLAELENILNQSLTGKKQFTQAPVRRMNRFQYHNAVTDLFQLNCAVFTLPERMMREHKDYFQPATGKMADYVLVGSRPLGKSQLIEKRLAGVAPFPQDLRAEHGYDNQGDHLSLSPLLMESFLQLSRSITESPDFTAKNVGIWNEFFQKPTGDIKAETATRLDRFLTRAFRRPVEKQVLSRYTNYIEEQLGENVPYTDVMKLIAAAAIASPKFLYLYDESTEADGPEVVSNFDLASRLSFFLWGSIPDGELIELAVRGELRNPSVLTSQFNRMIRDEKLKRFCDAFPAQWLQLERIISSTPSREHFPDFYFSKYRQSMHMMIEPLLLFETVLIENLPLIQLIDSDFTYRSDLLRKAYGETLPPPAKGPNRKAKKRQGGGSAVTVLGFQRLPVTDRRFGGVITNAAVMTMTSGPERTQPITRGAWLAGVIFNNPPEPPPADVPPLGEKPSAGEEHLTLRERLSMHRERADCRGCHEQIDPLGFALENFGPVGNWREKYENGRDVDMPGTLFRKHDFADVVEFKDAILSEKDRFTRGFAGHLLSFALGRKLGPADQPALDRIAEATAQDNYRIQTLMMELILSEPFLHKTNPKSSSKPALAN